MFAGVKELKKALLDVKFEKAMAHIKEIDWPAVTEAAMHEGAVDAITAVSMSCELLDYLGEFEECRDRLEPLALEAEQRIRGLIRGNTPSPKSLEERKIWKAWIWVLLQQGMMSYRELQFDRAWRLFLLCEEAILGFIRSVPDYPCVGTLGRIHYCKGLVSREQFDFESAKKDFSKSIEFAWQAVQKQSEQRSWTDLTIARALALGLGFVHLSEGQPDLALPVLLSAKNLVARLGEKLIGTCVDLIYFDAMRSAYGDDESIVDESIIGLERCHSTFAECNHDLYRARASYSLALAYSQRARNDENKPLTAGAEALLTKAESYCKDLEEYGISAKDPRAEAFALLCRSRIARKRNHLAEAENLASEAMKVAGKACAHAYASALIARAEARERQNKTDGALEDFRQALERSLGSLRARAMCLLRMSEIYAKRGEFKPATRYFEEWKSIKPHISNAYLIRLEQQAQAAMQKSSDEVFAVRLTDDTLNPGKLEQELHLFFTKWVARRTKNDQEAADLLGVTRQTILNWRNKKTQHGTRSESSRRRQRKKKNPRNR